jgi:hypothetical protein
LVFAALGVLGLLFTYAMYFGGLRMGPRNPVVELARSSPEYMSFLQGSLITGFIAIAVFAASGIGLLMLRSWGRKLAIAYALYAIVGAVVGMIVTHHYLLGPLSKAGGAAAGAGMMGGYLGGILGVLYPIVLLVFMTRRNVVDAFRRAGAPPLPPAHVVPSTK